jgi:hypothetical protein
LAEVGSGCGLFGETLRRWLGEQQEIEGTERAARREADKEEADRQERENEAERQEREKEAERQEREKEAERQEREKEAERQERKKEAGDGKGDREAEGEGGGREAGEGKRSWEAGERKGGREEREGEGGREERERGAGRKKRQGVLSEDLQRATEREERLKGYLNKWVEMSGVEKRVKGICLEDAMYDLIIGNIGRRETGTNRSWWGWRVGGVRGQEGP